MTHLPTLPDLPELTTGPAVRHAGVTAIPIFATAAAPCADYELGADAIGRGELEIGELPRGEPGRLRARNRGRRRALLVEGDHLLGARQNRILTSSVLVGRRGAVTLPVSCVERGRWEGPTARFDGLANLASPGLRRIAKLTVTRALLDGGKRGADQQEIWQHIATQQHTLRVTSATSALVHTYAARATELGAAADRLACPAGAIGVALGVGHALVSVDVFDNPRTCAHYWRRLIEGAALDALGAARRAGGVGEGDVARLLDALRAAEWTRVAAVGDGEERRARAGGAAASLLLIDGGLVHFGAAAGAVDLPLAVMRHDLPASLAARYHIAGRIGVGGTKEVFRAVDRRGGPDVAIARLPCVEPRLFDDEVALLRRVESDHVPRILDACLDEHGDGYLVMERCDGPSLAQVVGRGALAVADAAPLLIAFARGLRAIHDAHVLHRDVKLENAMLASSPGGATLKILDFGLSQRATSATTEVLDTPTPAGTPPYMAREVIRGDEVDARSDVYAFGVCCYRMLVGEFPVPPRGDERTLDYLRRTRDAVIDTSRLPALPEPARAAIARMLEVERDRRPFMPEVVAALEQAFGAPPLAAAPRVAVPRPLPLERAHRLAIPLASAEHLLVAACAQAPFIALAPDAWGTSTHVRAIAPDGATRWTRRLDGHYATGIRADLDGDGVREIYLAGRDGVVGLAVSGELRFARAAPRPGVPSLLGLPEPSRRGHLIVDGRIVDAATGDDSGALDFVYRGDGRTLVTAVEPRGLAYNGVARQGFCGDHASGAAIVHHPGATRFIVAQLEDQRSGRIALGVYGPGGSRLHHLVVAECPVDTGDVAAISRVYQRRAPLFGPQHAPLAVLGPAGTAAVIVPLLDPDEAVSPVLLAFELPSGRELWRCRREAAGGRALLADLDGSGRPQLVVGDGSALIAHDPWTGLASAPLPCKGQPVGFGDPLGSGAAHLITAGGGDGIELWRGAPCRAGAMAWIGARGDLWRTGTLRSDGAPLGPP